MITHSISGPVYYYQRTAFMVNLQSVTVFAFGCDG